jgi:hypothetical protein
MQTREIPPNHWHAFFADFTRLHQDQHVNVETMRQQRDHGVESKLCDLPLLGIVSARPQHGRQEWIEVVVAGGPSGPPETHSIAKPSRVCLAEEHGDAVALQVDSADGSVTMIRFEPPRENMPAGFTVS